MVSTRLPGLGGEPWGGHVFRGGPDPFGRRTDVRVSVALEGRALNAAERGLVVSCPIVIGRGGGVFGKSSNLDPQELRASLLFWDCLDWPLSSSMAFGSSADEEYLESAGILRRSKTKWSGNGFSGQILRAEHTGTFMAHEQREPGKWSLARGERSISFEDDQFSEGRGILATLYAAIPVPDRDVHLADILEFKRRRRSELLALRHHFDDIYQKIASSADAPHALASEVSRLDAAIADHVKSAREGGFPLRLAGWQAKINIQAKIDFTTVLGGLAGKGVSVAFNLPDATAALAVLAGAAIPSVSAGLALTNDVGLRGASAAGTPFEYISRIRDELF